MHKLVVVLTVIVTSITFAQDSGAEAGVYDLGPYALYVPPGVQSPRAVLVAIGGPNTRSFVTGEPAVPLAPADVASVLEPALQAQGQTLRDLASEHQIAILGFPSTSSRPMLNGSRSDQLIWDALAEGGVVIGSQDLASAPILMYGISGGAPQAAGFTARHPEQVVGLFLKVPPPELTALSDAAQRAVPTFIVLVENETVFDNRELIKAFQAIRGNGGLWGLAIEPGAFHLALSPTQARATVGWMDAVLRLRLGTDYSQLAPIDEQAGWLGNNATGEALAWTRYSEDRLAASWFPTQDVATLWLQLIGGAATP